MTADELVLEAFARFRERYGAPPDLGTDRDLFLAVLRDVAEEFVAEHPDAVVAAWDRLRDGHSWTCGG